MNIVTPTPTAIVFTTANVNTEAARRDNVMKETIPASKDAEQGAAEQGLGSESDRARAAGQKPAPVTYERPQVQTEPSSQQAENADAAEAGETADASADNANQESAGRESAEEKQQQQVEQQEITELKARDQEVRTHEQAHAAMGGQYAGSPQYEYETGPDNKRYITGGEVSIDVSEASSPENTIKKMEQVRAAALAPAQPSSQDLKVAAEAAQKASEARAELATAPAATEENSESEQTAAASDEDEISVEAEGARYLEAGSEENSQSAEIQSRIGVIQGFYQTRVTPRAGSFSTSA